MNDALGGICAFLERCNDNTVVTVTTEAVNGHPFFGFFLISAPPGRGIKSNEPSGEEALLFYGLYELDEHAQSRVPGNAFKTKGPPTAVDSEWTMSSFHVGLFSRMTGALRRVSFLGKVSRASNAFTQKKRELTFLVKSNHFQRLFPASAMLPGRAFLFCLRRRLPLSSPTSRIISIAALSTDISIHPSKYPLARRDETVVDDYHGVKIPDPYRFLEDPDAPETEAWVAELNKISAPFYESADIREKLRSKLTKLWNFDRISCPVKHGDSYYYWHNSGLQNQFVIYKQKGYKEKGEVFFDPNLLSEDGTTAITAANWSEDGAIFCYGLSEKGSDWVTLHFKTADGTDLKDKITGVKFSSIGWLSDNSGVFYSRYPEHKGAIAGSCVEKDEYHSLYFHKMGTPQAEDVLVADFRKDPHLMVAASVTRDGRFLIANVCKGCDPANQLFYADLKSINNQITGKVDLKPFFDQFDAKYDIVNFTGDDVLVLTNKDAPMNKLIRIKVGADNNNPSNWETVIPEDPKRKLQNVAVAAGDKMLVEYLQDCSSRVYINDFNTGNVLCQIPLEIGTLSSLICRKDQTEVFFSYGSFLSPTVVYRFDFNNVDLPSGKLNIEEVHRVNIQGFDASKFTAVQHFATSKDGTKVPMFIIHAKDAVLDGQNPTILNGYGGFGVSYVPGFSISQSLWLQSFGGIVAVANLRGGGEYGENWHQAGTLQNKQNVFDDFIACAEYLVDNKYTSPKKLAIQGGSNGGLLVGAVSQQRPDLIGGALNAVGVLDMLRFHKFTIGPAWIPEYGNPDKKEDFEYIYKYSPLHNIKYPENGVQWPSTLLLTADHDDRVVPLHSLKYMAQLYHTIKKDGADIQKNPVLCRVEVKAGHGAGKPTHKIIGEVVDMYSFLYRVLGAKYFD
uniref:Prolyl endopeptidase n=1 Tax=Panagrellus redivivus TaxID=6233 RepID=A0A7E4UNI6_PANRE